MIWLADSLPFGCQWEMSTLRVLKKWLELELVVLEVESGREIQIVLPQCGNTTRERGLQALLTWVLVITYTLHVFCACFRRKKRIKNAILMVHRFILIHSTLRGSACSARHFNAHLKFLGVRSRPQSIQFVRRRANKGCCVDVLDSMKMGSVLSFFLSYTVPNLDTSAWREILALTWNSGSAIVTFGAKFLDTIDKSKIHDCKRNLSPMILNDNQMVYSGNKGIILLGICQNCKIIRILTEWA